ncbi:hypothetical protein F441_15896 [Phytophthora nicotianae CJ01A1]|uniref:DDE Tnp4 domain-containing protein n=1 Tax=Phytophthora nicotianae CJ01A1 TaxID=1317063 RepID=W2WBS1_PHYNI|nr:hypothetical protein F441_15896 [Phytophthora nicotianae CJ01A1]
MLCRRLSEPSKLLTVASEFGRGTVPYSRIVKKPAQLLVNQHRDLVYFNYQLVHLRINEYVAAIHSKGSPLRMCWAFIDGTKQYVARPSARENPASEYENLQRALFNGHPRRHCFNWQSLQAPDGLIVSLFGPLEGRRHDYSMLNLSGLVDLMENDQSGIFCGKIIYGDPAYRCSRFICCPSIDTSTIAVKFNRDMNSVRESVEWGFGRVKTQWEFLNWDKKNRARHTAVGNLFFVGVL